MPVGGLDNGFVFAGVFLAFCMVTLSLAAYVYLLFAVGRHYGARPAVRSQLGVAFASALLGATVLGLLCLALPVSWIYRLVLAACMFLLHSFPLCIGLWAGSEHGREQEQALFERRTREWLGEWNPSEDGEETER